MEIIKAQKDIEGLRGRKPRLKTLLKEVSGYFEGIRREYEENSNLEFTLEKIGHIVILEPGDDSDDLTAAGIGKVSIRKSNPEAIEVIELEDGCLYWRARACATRRMGEVPLEPGRREAAT